MDTPKYPPIIVTGPQRSGTTIASRIIADDLNRTAIDESEFVFGNDYSNCIIQLPQALDHYIFLQHLYPGVHFLFIRRDPCDIVTSMKRIQWCKEDVSDWESFLEHFVASRILLWKHIKQQIPEDCSEIDYDALADHPLFVNTSERLEFTSKQWQVGVPIGPRCWSNNLQCTDYLYGSRHIASP